MIHYTHTVCDLLTLSTLPIMLTLSILPTLLDFFIKLTSNLFQLLE